MSESQLMTAFASTSMTVETMFWPRRGRGGPDSQSQRTRVITELQPEITDSLTLHLPSHYTPPSANRRIKLNIEDLHND